MTDKIYGLYARVSSDDQRENQNINSQIDGIKTYAKEKGLPIHKEYLDDGVSGIYLDRPGLDALRDDLKTGVIQGLIAYSTDRLSRKFAYQAILLDEWEKQGIEVHFVTERQIETEEDRLAQGMRGLFADYERGKILERTRRGKLFKIKQGNVMTSKPPYGFDYVQGDKSKGIQGYLKHNPKEIEVVKKILNWSLKGVSGRQIIRNLNEEGIKPRNGSAIWARSTISKLLSTNLDIYSGSWFYNKYEQSIPKNRLKPTKYLQSKKTSRKLRDQSEWTGVDISHLAIITKEQAQQIRANTSQNKALSLGNTQKTHLLQKMVYHTNCERLLYVDSSHGAVSYRCVQRKNSLFLDPSACKGGQIKSDILDTAVWNDVSGLILSPDNFIKEAQKYAKSKSSDDVLTGELAVISNRLAQLEEENQRLVTGYREGVITLDELKIQKQELKTKENQLISQKSTLVSKRKTTGNFNYDGMVADVKQLAKDLSEVLGELTKEERRQLLKWFQIKVLWGDSSYSVEGSLPVIKSEEKRYFNEASKRPLNRAFLPMQY